jgi:hypothetical protein
MAFAWMFAAYYLSLTNARISVVVWLRQSFLIDVKRGKINNKLRGTLVMP